MTQCSTDAIELKALGKRSVVAGFDGGTITSDAGAVLLDKTDVAIDLLRRAAECFVDHRDPDLVEHTVQQLVRQRVFGLALGYEDLNDHDELSRDPLLATVVGKTEPTGQARRARRDRDRPLAGKSTLNRLELTGESANAKSRYKKIVLDFAAMRSLFVDVFLDAHARPPKQIILDLDATDDPLHGRAGGTVLPRVLQGVLLPAAVRVLRRPPVGGGVASLEHRRQRRYGGVAGVSGVVHSESLAGYADYRAGGLGLHTRAHHGLV